MKIVFCLFGLLFVVLEKTNGNNLFEVDSVKFICSELLGRPTDNSIALNLCVDKNIEGYVEYGLQKNIYTNQTQVETFPLNKPFTIQIENLQFDTRYYYRFRYRQAGGIEFFTRKEHSFQTARAKGREFCFAIESDPHVDTSTNTILLNRTFANILNSSPDFLLDLGDTFMSEKQLIISQNVVIERNLLLRSFFDTLAHSVPLMLVQGNHDGEQGWLLNETADNLPVWAANTRKAYYPSPISGKFYSGDTTNVLFVGQRHSYYAWEWGNALFVVLDPYWFTANKPSSTKNVWDWTIGKKQYDWLAKTLQSSKADFKFVFAHQIIGGNNTEGRGGIEAVPYYEMGGLNTDGTQGFSTNRPGWAMPIHQLFVQNHVSAYFHGHDHIYVKQDLDGIVYNVLPQPGYFNFTSPEKSYSNISLAAKYGYTHGDVYPSSGFLRVTVRDTGATVDYVRSYLPEHENAQQVNGAVAFSYTIKKTTTKVESGITKSIPFKFFLEQNHPNPFNPSTTIKYQLPTTSHVALNVYDALGREVTKLVNEVKEAGYYSTTFDGTKFSSGIYFFRITTNNYNEIKKMILQK